jgi:hypothetical protein
MEKGMLATAQSHNRRLNSAFGNNKTCFSGQYQYKQLFSSDQPNNSPRQKKEQELSKPRPEAKFTEPGACKYYVQKWFFRHRCQQIKRLNVMASEKSNDSEDEQFHDTLYEETTENTTPSKLKTLNSCKYLSKK